MYFGNFGFSESPWAIHGEAQYRNHNLIGDLEQLLLRTGLQYNLKDGSASFLAGFGSINSESEGEPNDAFHENRLYQEVILRQNVVITGFALVVGLALGMGIFLPWFVQFSGWDLELNLLSGNLWIFLITLAVVTGVISGIYPSFYISKFEAVTIFKGSQQFGRKNPISKIFLGAQLRSAVTGEPSGKTMTLGFHNFSLFSRTKIRRRYHIRRPGTLEHHSRIF